MRHILAAVAAPLVVLALAGTALAGHAAATKVTVSFDDRKLALSPSGIEAGTTTIVVVNHGKRVHSLAIEGPGVKGVHTPKLPPGTSATLTVTLKSGAYSLTFTNPAGLGMGSTRWIQVIPKTVISTKGGSSVVNSDGDTSMCGYLAP
jgi:plastocyanin